MTTRAFGVLLLGVLALAGRANAQEPRWRAVEEKGSDESVRLDYELQRIELQGVDPQVARRVNGALRELCDRGRRAMVRELKDWPDDLAPAGARSFLVMSMSVGTLDRRLLSVEVMKETFMAGTAHPSGGVLTATFDLRDGKRIPTRRLFAKGDDVLPRVAALVDHRLRRSEEYGVDGAFTGEGGAYILAPVTADRIRSVVVGPDGLTFSFGDGELGPHAAGMPTVTIPFAELDGLLDPAVLPPPTRGLTAVVESTGR
jgi:hypothetical protein